MFEGRPDVMVVSVPPVLGAGFARDVRDSLSSIPDAVSVVAFVPSSAEVFCTGLDLEMLVGPDAIAAETAETLRAIGDALTSVHLCSRPTLAVATGAAFGGGVGLLAACDYVVASAGAIFGLPEMSWGFVPAAIWPLLLARIGPARARAWAMTAFARSAPDALAAGLVDELADPARLAEAARRAARNLARVDRDAMPLLRSWTQEASRLSTVDAIQRGAELSAEQLGEPRVRDRLGSFLREGVAPWQRGRSDP